MSFRCLSVIAFLMAGRPSSGPLTFRAWMRAQRTTLGMGGSFAKTPIMPPRRGLGLGWAAGRKTMMLAAAVALAAALQAPAAGACHEEPVAWIPAELMARPITLQQDVGRVHEAVTTRSAEAQAFYDQGLTLLHSYAYIDAARSFHQALRIDPRLAMAYV